MENGKMFVFLTRLFKGRHGSNDSESRSKLRREKSLLKKLKKKAKYPTQPKKSNVIECVYNGPDYMNFKNEHK